MNLQRFCGSAGWWEENIPSGSLWVPPHPKHSIPNCITGVYHCITTASLGTTASQTLHLVYHCIPTTSLGTTASQITSLGFNLSLHRKLHHWGLSLYPNCINLGTTASQPLHLVSHLIPTTSPWVPQHPNHFTLFITASQIASLGFITSPQLHHAVYHSIPNTSPQLHHSGYHSIPTTSPCFSPHPNPSPCFITASQLHPPGCHGNLSTSLWVPAHPTAHSVSTPIPHPSPQSPQLLSLFSQRPVPAAAGGGRHPWMAPGSRWGSPSPLSVFTLFNSCPLDPATSQAEDSGAGTGNAAKHLPTPL